LLIFYTERNTTINSMYTRQSKNYLTGNIVCIVMITIWNNILRIYTESQIDKLMTCGKSNFIFRSKLEDEIELHYLKFVRGLLDFMSKARGNLWTIWFRNSGVSGITVVRHPSYMYIIIQGRRNGRIHNPFSSGVRRAGEVGRSHH